MYSGYQTSPSYVGPPPNSYNSHPGSLPPPAWQQQQYLQPNYPPQPQPQPQPGYINDPSSSAFSTSVAADPDAFARMYNTHLASLTFNSKPIITNLTVMAHEHVHQMANVVARSIDEHIVQAPPTIRLPALYVLDSISKNIGAPYTTLWSQRIAHLFLETYRLVDQQTKMRMEELLGTWRTGGQGGSPLFGGDAQWAIERSIYGSAGVPGGPPPMRPQPAMRLSTPLNVEAPRTTHSPAPPPIRTTEASRAIEQIDRLVALMSLDQQRRLPSFNPQRMAALKQLRTVVATATLSTQEMNQIQTQLDTLALEFKRDRGGSHTPAPGPVVAPAPPQPPFFGSSQNGRSSTPNSDAPPLPADLSAALASLTRQGVIGDPFQHQRSRGNASMSPAPQPPPPTLPSDELMRNLIAAGLLPAPGPGVVPVSAKTTKQDDAYTSAILSLGITLTSLDLQKELTEDLVDLVGSKYLPLQCRQCANRYPAGQAGQKSLDAHLDWHFRQGRRAKESAARGLSRSWLDVATEWLRGGQDDPSTSLSSETGGTADGKNGLSLQQEAELKEAQEMWIVAPTSSDKTNSPCPICNEKFVSEWSEDEEEWIWKNARRVEEEIYHGTCYYSAKVLSSNVANRGTTGTPGARGASMEGQGARSRTLTPEVHRIATNSANPVERVKNEEAQASGENSRKRKESPSLATLDKSEAGEGDEGGAAAAAAVDAMEHASGEPETKRVALQAEA